MKVDVPIKTCSPNGSHGHWSAKANRAKSQRFAVMCAMAGKPLPKLPVTVTITRVGKKKLDSDNLAISAKHVRDQVAAAYGIDDADERYTWNYSQRVGKHYGVEILIEGAKR